MPRTNKKAATKELLPTADFRHDESKRTHLPPAGIASQGKVAEKPKRVYEYNLHLQPVLRFDASGKVINSKNY